MNKQMIDLYKQAQEFAYKNISKESWNTDNFHAVVSGKFAELIVRECIDTAFNKGHPDLEFLLKHFGVKE